MTKNFDVIVLGGGFTGVAASVAAAREGCSVLLIEQSGYLGGSATNCLVNPFMCYWTTMEVDGEKKRVELSRGIFKELNEELRRMDAMIHGTHFHEEYLKLILDRYVTKEGVAVLFHSVLAEVEKEGESLRTLTVVNKAGKQTFSAKCFIDASGDGDLSVMSGCPFRLGRDEDQLCQPMTLCFRLGNIDKEEALKHRKENDLLYAQFQREGKIKNPREDILIFDHPATGVLHFNTTRIVKLNPTDPFDVTKAEMAAREQMLEIFHFLKENCKGFEQCELLFSAPWIGVRESRMIEGEHILTGQELKDCTKFEDAIAAGNYDIDIHNPEGSGTSHYFFQPGEYYTIPYRSLTPKKADNLLVAGRCISSTHEAQASYRIMPIVCCIGEAAGVAASVVCKDGVSTKAADVKKIQAILKQNGAFF